MRKYPSNFLRINISTFVSWNRPSYCCSMFHAINSENGKCRTKKQKQSWESEEIIEHEPNISLLTFVNQMEVGLTCKIVQMSSCSCIFDVYSTYSSMRKMNAKRQVGVEGWWRSWNKLEQKSMNPPVDRVKLNRKTLFLLPFRRFLIQKEVDWDEWIDKIYSNYPKSFLLFSSSNFSSSAKSNISSISIWNSKKENKKWLYFVYISVEREIKCHL